MGKSKDLATLKSGLSIDGTLTTTSTGTNLTSNSYNVVKIQTDKDDNGSNDDAILQFTTGSSNTVKGELRYDESESMFEIGQGDNQGHIRIDGSGRVTKPNQPMFHAYNSTNDTFTTTEAKHNFNSTRINVGSHFNTSLSRFVAPTDGYYFFTWGGTITITANDPYITAYLRKNGASPGGMRTRANSTSGSGYRYWGAAGAEVQYMAANDYMEVYHYSQNGNASSASPEYVFTGFLIGQDKHMAYIGQSLTEGTRRAQTYTATA